MKKRILSLALVLMLCLSLLPMAALAASEEAATEPVEATTETTGEIVAEPTPEPTPEPVALEGASAETSETTDEPSVQSMNQPQVAQEGEGTTQTPIDYVDPTETGAAQNKTCNNYTEITDTTTTWNEGWYVVKDTVTITGSVTLSGDVNLILCDNATLTVSNGIVGEDYSLTIYGQSGGTGALTVTTEDVSTMGEDSGARSYGIYTEAMTVNGGTLTVTAGSATATGNGSDSDSKSRGIYVTTLTVNGGELTATAGTATSTSDSAYSYGIRVDSITVNGGTVTGTAGDAESTNYKAKSYGIYTDAMTVNGGTVTGEAGDATGSGFVESYGIYACDSTDNDGNGALTVKGGNVTGTAGAATSTGGDAWSDGIETEGIIVNGGTVTATRGEAENAYDIYVYEEPMTLSKGTVQSGREGDAVSVCAYEIAASGGTMKLGEDSCLYNVETGGDVTLADLLADGYAYWKVKVEDDYNTYNIGYTPIGFVTLDGLTKLEDEYGNIADTWYEYYVKPCTHSTDDGLCAYCGKSVGDASAPGSDAEPAPTATPAPTAAPTATPAPTTQPKAPNTADEANVTLWLALAMLSMMAVVVVARKKAR